MRLKDYIQGNRRGKEANRLEREAMNDPFLQDALDGFDAVAGDHVHIIERLERKFTNPAETHHRIRTLWYWSVAASILLLVGMSAYFFLERTEKTTSIIAMNQPNENENVMQDDSMSSQPAQIKELQQETPARQKTSATPALKEPLKVPKTEADITADVAEIAVADAVVHEVVADEILVESSAKSLLISEQRMPAVQGKVVDETGEPLPEKSNVTGAVSKASAREAVTSPFGEKEFQTWCQQNGNKNVCDGKGPSVKTTFFIDETGKPTKIEYKKYTCEDAKIEMGKLLSSSPAWTKTKRKVTMTVEW